MDRSGVLPPSELSNRKSLGTCDALLCISHLLPRAFKSGQEARIVQIDFSTDFDRGHHHGILFKLCSVGFGGFIDTVPNKSITARYGGPLSEQTY